MHFTVVVWGFTAILGRLISLPAMPLVWYRLLVVVAVMTGVVAARGLPFRVSRSLLARFAVAGTLVAVHWVLFYGCIKYAGVAVAVLCLSTGTFFTALLEPLVFRRAPRLGELLIGLAVTVGVSFLVRVEAGADFTGLAMGLGSSLFAASFGTLNGQLARESPGEVMTLHELAIAAAVVSLGFLVWPGDFVPPAALSGRDVAMLLVLAIVCTVLPWLWSLKVLRTLSPYSLSLAVSLEPVYAMALAWLLFPGSEQLTWRFYLGTSVLLVLVALNTWLKRPRAVAPHPPAAPAPGPSAAPGG
jgi:drug/metabolite transporter (DMT)-like permease